jgi:hypothetical protein
LTSKPKFTNCSNCHIDYHNGEFTENNRNSDCKDCHNEKGFSPSLFTIENHSKTKFELKYAHAATPCNLCHLKEAKWQFNIVGEKCTNCHENFHNNKISTKYFDINKCENCHSTWNWKVTDFDHNKTDFELRGKHKSVSCSDCHFKVENEKIVEHIFANLNSNCTQCHKDVHYGQFIKADKELCSNCHTSNSWDPELFDHNKTKFALDGKHVKLKCEQCHKVVGEGKDKFINYTIEETSCKSCHS